MCACLGTLWDEQVIRQVLEKKYPENSLQFTIALRKHKVPFELHIYEIGLHGLSLCDDTVDAGNGVYPPDNANWSEMAIKWLKRL